MDEAWDCGSYNESSTLSSLSKEIIGSNMKTFIVPKEKVVNEWQLLYNWLYQKSGDRIAVLAHETAKDEFLSSECKLVVSINGEVFITKYDENDYPAWAHQTEVTFYPAKLVETTIVKREWVAA